MSLKKKIRKITIIALLTLTASPVLGQDLLARQAPVDRRSSRIDTMQMITLKAKEEKESPAAQLYDDWNNRYAHKENGNLPDKFKIDLHHFCMPTPSRVVTSNFGSRWGRQHKGLDIKVYIGDTIRAAFDGKVRVVRYEGGGYGKYIVIRHPNGLETTYGHLSKQLVSEDDVVKAGDVIGLGGNTGRSTGSHLHFETRLCGVALNPALFFDFRNQDVTGDFYTFNKDSYEEESATATRLRGKIGGGGYTRELVKGTSTKSSIDNSEPRYHKVKSGETLATIAAKRGVSIDRICELNNITKSTKVRPGQILRYT
jgi:murein DD-endopeptidase MepM/ murein hydrolase activator NlpD